jgi:hypothetical protein
LLTSYEFTITLLAKYRAAYSIIGAHFIFLDGLMLQQMESPVLQVNAGDDSVSFY